MKTGIRQAILLTTLAVILGLATNTLTETGIPFFGNWPSLAGSDSIIVPPSADEGDPPFISLDEAAAKFQTPGILFIDARDPEDYEYGHIKGAISIPYDYLEDINDPRVTSVPKDQGMVIYCSGTECESSLYLGRDFQYKGYTEVSIFFGGWREWNEAGLPVEQDI